MSFRLIGVPTSAGAYGIGQERTPQALRQSGLLESITADIADQGDLPLRPFRPDPHNRRAQNIDTVAEVAVAVRDAVSDIVTDGDIPVVLGGDCTITLGVVAGVRGDHPDAGLAYFDGDVDMSTPQTTQSGILDAMGIAHLLNIDGADLRLAGLGDELPLLDGGRLALIGFEVSDLSEDHEGILKQRGVGLFPASALRDDLPGTLSHIDRFLGESPRVVHFDVDAIDSVESPLAEFPHFNSGVSLAIAGQILVRLCDTPRLAAVVVTEANPLHDPDETYIPQLRDTIADAINGNKPSV